MAEVLDCDTIDACHAKHGTLDNFPHEHDDGRSYARCTNGRPCLVTAHAEHLWPVIPDGVHYNLPEADYYRARAVSQSTIKRMIEPGGPAKVLWERTHPRLNRREFDLGHAAHSLVLGVGAEIVDVGNDLRLKTAREADKAARQAGKIPLRTADVAVVNRMADQIRQHPAAQHLLDGAVPEVSVFHTTDGLQIKGRIDAINGTTLIDYKTTGDASPAGFANSAAKYSYHIQAAAYLELAQHAGLEVDRFVFIAQEKTAPYLVNVVELDADFLTYGITDWHRGLDLWRECVETGVWPGYPNETDVLRPPRWLARTHDNLIDPAVEAAFADFFKEL